MMLILKIPIIYLCLVVYWAVKAEPKPPEPALLPAVLDPEAGPPTPWTRWRTPRRRPRGRPHGSPARGYARTARAGRSQLAR